MNNTPRTRLALLGTLSDLHRHPIAYDLACLRALVADLAPDLLCAEVTREAWEGSDLSAAGVEVREALAPIAALTDVVLIPVAPTPMQFGDFAPRAGWRRRAAGRLDRLLRWGERRAGRPEAVNGPLFGPFCHTVCTLNEALWGADQRASWAAQNRAMADAIVQAARRDPGRRVLVAVQCQRLHRLVPPLRQHSDVLEIVPYQDL